MTLRSHTVPDAFAAYHGNSSQQNSIAQTPSELSSDTKSDRAAILAQQLGSDRSWADTFVPQGAVPPRTPKSSTMGEQNMLVDVCDDPPPAYEPPSRTSTLENSIELPAEPIESSSATTQSEFPQIQRMFSSELEPRREYARSETYQSITGVFTFYDSLDLSTRSGSINITLDPQPGDGPATLVLSTGSGSIKVGVSEKYQKHLQKDGVITRPWDITIKSQSGSIQAKLPLGNGGRASIDAELGSVKCWFYCASMGPTDPITTLRTETKHGTQKVLIESMQGSLPITQLKSSHHAKGHGTLKIDYPKTWQGTVRALKDGNGKLKITGDDMQFQHFGDSEGIARRGDGQDMLVKCDGHGGAKVTCS